MRYVLGETLQEYQEEIMEKDRPSVFLATSQTARDCLEQAGMQYEGEINLKDVGFCKMETQQECLAGSLCIPKLLDILGERYKILFFINRHHIVIVDDDEFSYRLIRTTKLYYFIDAKQLSRLLFSDFPMHRQTPLYRIRALRQDP